MACVLEQIDDDGYAGYVGYVGYVGFIVMQIRPAAVQLIMIYAQNQITHKASPFCWSEKSILNYKPRVERETS